MERMKIGIQNNKKDSKTTENLILKMILTSDYLLDLKSVLMGMLVLMSSTTLSLGLS